MSMYCTASLGSGSVFSDTTLADETLNCFGSY